MKSPRSSFGATSATPNSLAVVSVIIPAYNAERFLEATIQSVSVQTYPWLEIIIVDDGSTDGTSRLIHELKKDETRLRSIYQRNCGLPSARNCGIAAATGDFIAFLDADDLWLPNKLALQLKASPQADVLFTAAEHFSEESSGDLPINLFQSLAGFYTARESFRRLYARNDIPVSSVMINRATLAKAGGFRADPRFAGCEDWELWLRLARGGASFFGSREKLVRYRTHAAQMSGDRTKMVSSCLSIAEEYAPFCETRSEARVQIIGLHRDLARMAIARNDFPTALRIIFRLFQSKISGFYGYFGGLRSCYSLIKALSKRFLNPSQEHSHMV